jgi:polysaccharide biosynthesis/export protein
MQKFATVAVVLLVLEAFALRQIVAGPQESGGPAFGEPYLIGPGDRIAISALHADEINGAYMIDEVGDISTQLLGRVHVIGLSTKQVEGQLVELLSRLVQKPQVAVSIAEFGSRPVSVLGAVNRPGVYQMKGRTTLLEVLSIAGGLRTDAGSRITIERRRNPPGAEGAEAEAAGAGGETEVTMLQLSDPQSPARRFVIRAHDTVVVGRGQSVYVLGEVERPGSYPVNESQKLPMLEAISLAGGVKRTGQPDKAKILRPGTSGTEQRTQVPVNLASILKGKSDDAGLLPNDILYVPAHGTKQLAVRVAETAVQVGTQVLTWGIVYR